ncbi:YbhB/YbcL family Raf kinase inhibitor-like protein (plasmid) [Rhizobium ruizarguesonis]|uniref:YbhB/YbcL family Raf kinase inhibitor-like protein n=1 Tax=Rhizobium ruizarguesonis TaxID=2081791 RepID=UPI0010306609|nr:YbhB/YbcL family Raf kinase inhibitor-like protein [Rhizobium ruizarguesonis]TBB14993.1 YbhB/YbcL family Raf kinase inhibitor-like protein [Rhizobium ruizarguesonis]
MKKIVLAAALSLLTTTANAADMRLSSSDVEHNKQLADLYVQNGSGCRGGDQSPALSWSGAPEGTKSFAVTLYDPDAPTGSGWWHWSVLNIPTSVNHLDRNAGQRDGSKLPAGAVQGRTDFAVPGYGGACPPAGDKTHHYHFKIWALSVEKLEINTEMSAAQIGYMVRSNSLASAELVPISTR